MTIRFRLFCAGLTTLALSASLHPQEAPPLQRPLDPAGEIVLGTDGRMAEGALPVAIHRSPDTAGPDGGGRYLVVVNSGFGSELSRHEEHGRQSLQVIDLNASPPAVVQDVYFPSPQSANVGLAFGRRPVSEGVWPLYVSGGVQNHVWRFTFAAGQPKPIAPANDGPTTLVKTRTIDVTAAASAPPARYYNGGIAPAYPTGLAVGRMGTLYVAANLGDALAVVEQPEQRPRVSRVDLKRKDAGRRFLYPYDVRVIQERSGKDKVYVSLWNDDAIVVVDGEGRRVKTRVPTGAHPSALAVNGPGTRLAVVNANADTVSIIDTRLDTEVERVAIGLGGSARIGNSPQALAFSESGRTLLVANAQSQSVAVVALSKAAAGRQPSDNDWDDKDGAQQDQDRSRVLGYIPTARYPSALAVVGTTLFVGNGKGEPAARSNAPNAAFPPNHALRGGYSVAIMGGSLRRVTLPDQQTLAAMTNRVLGANGLVGEPRTSLFQGPSPIRHVIYVIKENRTYDQVFGDVAASGDGSKADGEPSLAIFGAGTAARRRNGPAQDITPNHRALALRFGLFDRFFVNSEASPDGHAWATSAFSTEYVDKAFRWEYSGRGRTYDYEGFNRLPDLAPGGLLPPPLRLPLTVRDVSAFLKRYVPYLNGSRDVSEPETLYLWDAAARAGLSYRIYGEFVSTLSGNDIDALNAKRSKRYPDLSPNVDTFATKKSLEGHFSTAFRNFDLATPDAMTTASYTAAKADSTIDPLVRTLHPDTRFKGASRIGAWLDDFDKHVADLASGSGDHLPALTILRLPNDHTAGMTQDGPTPQFLVADNDYALGRLVQAVSSSPYWRDTAIMVLEDDAQDGPDHVDVHRSPALVISAYNRHGALIHAMHNTVSLIRTLELLIGMAPMNALDAAAIPMDVFTDRPDLTPYTAVMPSVAPDNLLVPRQRAAEGRRLQDASARQDFQNPDMADPAVLNAAIWYSVRGTEPMPPAGRLAAVDAMQTGLDVEGEDAARQPLVMARLALRKQLHVK